MDPGPGGAAVEDDHIALRLHAERRRPFDLIGTMNIDIRIDGRSWRRLSGQFTTASLRRLAYAILLRPLHSQPTLADYFLRVDSF
jgi:hypothetical protein